MEVNNISTDEIETQINQPNAITELAPPSSGQSEPQESAAQKTGGIVSSRSPEPGTPSGLESNLTEEEKRARTPVSERKLTANRKNAQLSTGPKTMEGKAKSSQNRYIHGLFAQHLIRSGGQTTKDTAAYSLFASQIRDSYRPVGAMEEFLVEKIVTESVRYARLLGYEKRIIGGKYAFYETGVDKILRYQASINRQLFQTMKVLDDLQEKRKTNPDSPGPTGVTSSIAATEDDAAGLKLTSNRDGQSGLEGESQYESQRERGDSGSSGLSGTRAENHWYCLGAIEFPPDAHDDRPQSPTSNAQPSSKGATTGELDAGKSDANVGGGPYKAPTRNLGDIVTEALGLPKRDLSSEGSQPTQNCGTNPPNGASDFSGSAQTP
jgi:hypothetical protein